MPLNSQPTTLVISPHAWPLTASAAYSKCTQGPLEAMASQAVGGMVLLLHFNVFKWLIN